MRKKETGNGTKHQEPREERGNATRVGLNNFKFKNHKQTEAVKAIKANDITFLIGPAGTGKTILSVFQGLTDLLSNKVDRIVLTRPVIEAGESLGFLPGDANEKCEPYMQPMFDHLKRLIPREYLEKYIQVKQIEIVPLAYMRGRNLIKSYVIADEMQNATDEQLKMLLTRIGDDSKMVICADPEQTDLRTKNNIFTISKNLTNIEGIGRILFEEEDIVRHKLISSILKVFREIKNAS